MHTRYLPNSNFKQNISVQLQRPVEILLLFVVSKSKPEYREIDNKLDYPERKMYRIHPNCSISECCKTPNILSPIETHSVARNFRTSAAHGHLRSKWLLRRGTGFGIICFSTGEETSIHSAHYRINISHFFFISNLYFKSCF